MKYRSKQFRIEQLENEIQSMKDARKLKEEKEKAEREKWYESTVYCTNCKRVHNIISAPGQRIDEGNCVYCKVRSNQMVPTLFLVVEYPGKGICR